MAETKRKRPPSFKLEIPANEKNELLQNLQKVREVLVKQLGRPVNNTDIMDALVVKKSEVNQDFFLTSVSSVSRLMDVAAIHGKHCCRKLEVKKVTKRGHVVSLKLRCTRTDRAKHICGRHHHTFPMENI